MNLKELIDIAKGMHEQTAAFIAGVFAGLATEGIVYLISKTTFIIKFEKWITTAILTARLRRVNNFSDYHAQIRHEWSMAIRDIGSSQQKIAAVALEMLIQMRDLLEDDEKKVAFEALRFRIALNKHRENDIKYAKAVSLYSE